MKKEEKKIHPAPGQYRARRVFTGEVVSDRMKKTLVIRVDRMVVHPRYGKRFLRSRRYKVHDSIGKFHVGDVVRFRETRPISKEVRWRVIYPSE